jgi:DUF2938 family protein
LKLVFALIAASIRSTLTMDIAGGILRSTGLCAGLPAGLVGKWIESSLHGKVFLNDILASPGEPTSLQRFLFYHYSIGMLLTVILYALVVMFKAGPVSRWIPMLYGPTTSVLPLLLMFPAMGFGCWGYKGRVNIYCCRLLF